MYTKNVLLATAMGLLAACSSGGGKKTSANSSSSQSSQVSSAVALDTAKVQQVLNTNADIALAAYNDSVATAEALQTALAAFKADPTQANLDAAKLAWLVAREPYGQTEVYRFRLSPIDSTDYAQEDGPEGEINAWPLGEALIDYVVTGTGVESDFGEAQVGVSAHATGVDYPNENLIQSDIPLTADLLSNTATASDEHDVIAGYHAIEFMLWGQDLNLDGSANTASSREESTPGNVLTSGGHRPLTDFTSDADADRRHTYLELLATKLIGDLKSVRDGWLAGADYRTEFTSFSDENEARQKLSEILLGMGTLAEKELAGERMQIAFSSNSQEDEHSCFSDNTHRDIWLNSEGVTNSYYGDYEGYDSDLDGVDDAFGSAVNGYGIDDYLDDVGLGDLADRYEAALATTQTHVAAIDQAARGGQPVDVLIMDENRNSQNPISQAIIALTAQTQVLKEIGLALEIDSVVDPEASACDTSQPDTLCD